MEKYIIADENIPYVNEFFYGFGKVKLFPAKEINSNSVKDADILLVRSVTKVNKDLLLDSDVKFVGTATIGTDHIDQSLLNESHIFFTNAAGSNANSVAEFVIVSLLFVCENRKISLDGKKIGIIGVGNIGSLVAHKAALLGLKPLLYDPPRQRISNESGFCSLDDIYDCDIITCHVPLTKSGEDKTFHLLDGDFFANLPGKCIVINTSRGPVVDNQALKNYLKHNPESLAILDVWENEPEPDAELLEIAAVATPHIAGYSLDGKVNGTKMLYDKLCKLENVSIVHQISDFLPGLENSTIEVNIDSFSTSQSVLAHILSRAYDIDADNRSMKAIVGLELGKHADYFTALRKNYPVRREFSSWTVKRTGDLDIDSVLKQLGFKLYP